LPTLDTQSPRVQAAMKVLGVLPRELELEGLATFSGGSGDEARRELFERKRHNIIREIAKLADKMPKESHEPAGRDPNKDTNGTFVTQILRMEEANMQKMQKQRDKGVQKAVIGELSGKLQVHLTETSMRESQKRYDNLAKARDEKMAAAKKEAQKKADRSKDSRDRAAKTQLEESEELMKNLNEANARKKAKLEEILECRKDAFSRSREKQATISQRLQRLLFDDLQRRESMYTSMENRHDLNMSGLAKKSNDRDAAAAQLGAKLEKSIERVRKHQEMKNSQAEERHQKDVLRHNERSEKKAEKLEAYQTDLRVANNKKRNAHQQRYDRLLQDLEESPRVSRRLTQSQSMPDVTNTRASESRVNMTDLFGLNQSQARRAHSYAQKQALSKIDHHRSRVQARSDSLTAANQRRFEMLKNCAIEQYHLSHELERVCNATPERMNKFLVDLDPEPTVQKQVNDLLKLMDAKPLFGTGGEEDSEKT